MGATKNIQMIAGMAYEEASEKDQLFTMRQWVVIAVVGMLHIAVETGVIPNHTVVP